MYTYMAAMHLKSLIAALLVSTCLTGCATGPGAQRAWNGTIDHYGGLTMENGPFGGMSCAEYIHYDKHDPWRINIVDPRGTWVYPGTNSQALAQIAAWVKACRQTVASGAEPGGGKPRPPLPSVVSPKTAAEPAAAPTPATPTPAVAYQDQVAEGEELERAVRACWRALVPTWNNRVNTVATAGPVENLNECSRLTVEQQQVIKAAAERFIELRAALMASQSGDDVAMRASECKKMVGVILELLRSLRLAGLPPATIASMVDDCVAQSAPPGGRR